MTTVSTRLPKYSMETYKLLERQGKLTLRMGYGMEWVFGSKDATDLDKDLKKYAPMVGTGDDFTWVTSVAPTEVDGATTRACISLVNSFTIAASGASPVRSSSPFR